MACLICNKEKLNFLFKEEDFLVVRCWGCGIKRQHWTMSAIFLKKRG